MRIVAGMLRGRTIKAPEGEGTRPTTDRVREALFSSLYSMREGFDGAIVFDAFAGSGALGIESLSRGASEALFFEQDARAAAVLRLNLASCGLEAHVEQRNVLESPPLAHRPPFDLVFLDPPYRQDPQSVLAMVSELSAANALSHDAIIVYEHSWKESDDLEIAASKAGLEVRVRKKYGKTGVSIMRRL